VSLLGVDLRLLIGPTVPVPAPPSLTEALLRAEVTHSDRGRSGFQLVFRVERAGPSGLLDYGLADHPLLRPFNRVILTLAFGPLETVILDGVVTDQQLTPEAGGGGTLSVTGEDVSVMMDLEERSAEHPGLPDAAIAAKIIARYSSLGLTPMIVSPPAADMPLALERVPVQQGTDLAYLDELAARHDHRFFVTPGPVPGANLAYWGPPPRLEVPQRALSVDMAGETNVSSISFSRAGLAPEAVVGEVQDRESGESLPVFALAPLRAPLSLRPAWLAQQPNVRRSQLRVSGLTYAQAAARAQARVEAASDAVTATGELDGVRYGAVLRARGIVGVRGAGLTHDGLYYVGRLTHLIERSSYRVRFSLSREGVGSTTPVVAV